MASPAWIEQNFGRKIQKAAELAESGDAETAVVREPNRVIALKQDSRKERANADPSVVRIGCNYGSGNCCGSESVV